MKYRVLAHSKDTGQKMVLEFEAQSKADAERKARPHNVNIIRVEPAEATPDGEQPQWKTIQPRRAIRFPWAIVFLLALAGAVYYFWPVINRTIGTFHSTPTSRPAPASPE